MVGVLMFGMLVGAPIAVRVIVGLLLEDVEGVLAVHASEGHPQRQCLSGKAGFERPVEEQVREALREVDVYRGVHDYADVAGPDCCGRWCGGDGVRQGAQFAVGGRPEDGGPGVVLHVEEIRTADDTQGGTTDRGGALLGARCVSEVVDVGVAGYGQAGNCCGLNDVFGVPFGGSGGGLRGL